MSKSNTDGQEDNYRLPSLAEELVRRNVASNFRPSSIFQVPNRADVRFWHKADITSVPIHVRFWGQSGHCLPTPRCPLITQSGHQQIDFQAPVAVSMSTVAGLAAGIVKEILRGSVPAVANGVPGDGEEASAKVHTDGVAALEGVPEIGLDVDPTRAYG